MERIRDHPAGMAWRQPRPIYPEWELRRGGQFFAEVDISPQRQSAKAFDRAWQIRVGGFPWRRLLLVDERTEQVAVTATLRWGKTSFVTAGGREYKGEEGAATYHVTDGTAQPVLRFERKMRLFRREADVTYEPAALGLPELPELVVAAWLAATWTQWSPHVGRWRATGEA